MRIYFLFLLSILLSCGHIPETRYYRIDYPIVQQKATKRQSAVCINRFKADPLYSQDKLIYTTSRYEMRFDHYRRWITPLPEMLTEKAVQHLRASGMFNHVANDYPAKEYGLVISATIKRFDEDAQGDDHVAKVAIWFKIENSSHELVWSGLVEKESKIVALSADGVIKAFSDVTQMIFDELLINISELID